MNKKYSNIIIDYETLGQSPHNSPVISLAVSVFDFDHSEKKTIEEIVEDTPQLFVKFIVTGQVKNHNRVIGKETLKWWKEKPTEKARIKSLYPNKKLDVSVEFGHKQLNTFVREHCKGNVLIWCRGASFDFPFLECIFSDYDIGEHKWFKFWNQRDTRSFICACLNDVTSTNCPLPKGTLDNFVHHDPVWDNAKEILQLQYAYWYNTQEEEIPDEYDIVKSS